MTLEEIKTLYAYNSWANNRLFTLLSSLPADQYMKDMKSSHGGIRGTLTHMVSAERVWLGRFQSRTEMPLREEDFASLAPLKEVWEKSGYETAKWLGTMTDKKLGESFSFTTAKGDTITHIFWRAFQHLVNHASYHRGQITTMLRQLGAEPVNTDLSRFYREIVKSR